MSQADENRVIATNWREYLKDTRESLDVYAWVWKELIPIEAKRLTKRLLVFVAASMAISMAIPWAVAYIFDGLIVRDATVVVWALGVMTALLFVEQIVRKSIHRTQTIIDGSNIIRIDVRLSELFFEKSLGQHLREDDTLTASNVEKGRERVRGIMDMILFEVTSTLIDLAICLLFLWILAPIVGLLMTALLAVYVIWAIYLNRKVIEACTPIERDWRRINRHRAERWDNPERVKTCGKEAEEVGVIDGGLTRAIGAHTDFWVWTTDFNLRRGLIKIAFMCLAIAYGTWVVWKGDWTVGILMPLITWSGRYADNLWRVGQFEHRLNWSLPSVRSMREALSKAPEVQDAPDAVLLGDDPVEIEMVGVTHVYRTKDGSRSAHVLRGVDLSVRTGEKVALIGESGAGKTTIMRLLQRYEDPEGGRILVNGVDLRKVRIESFRRLTAYIPQQAQIYDGTIRYNLLYGMTPDERRKVTDEDLWELMRDLRIDFGDRLDDGLDTGVGYNGIKLSGGEAQRLMIGSAVIRRPRFLIVDEATSSLDSTTEKDVQEGFRKLLEASTSALIITHRLPTVRHLCTKFIVLKPVQSLAEGESQIEAVGTSFEHLYRISPTFKRLADDQGVPCTGIPADAQVSASASQGHWWNC